MSAFLGGIAVNIISSLIDKAGTFVAGQAGNRIDWKVWKIEHKFSENESDFLDRYAEALIALNEAGKPKELLQFYGREHVIQIIHDYWYGELDTPNFEKEFNDLIHWFTIDAQLADFNAPKEVFFFLTHYRKAVNENRTAGETEVYQLLLEILKEIRLGNPKNTSELYDQVFIYANRSDQAWVERELLPRLDEIGWKYHTDFRLYSIDDFTNWKEKVKTCRNTIVIYSQNLSEDERRLVDGFISLERPEVVADKLLPFKLADVQVPEKLREAYDFTNAASSTAAWQRLDVSFAQIAVEAPKTYPPLASNLIDITSLPNGGIPGLLFGRQTELALLDKAWEDPNCHVICFTAQGGQGKSALINRWLDEMGKDNYRGAERVFATSFYSQGTGERVTSADQFINAALKWLEERAASEGGTRNDTLTTTDTPTSPWEKGKRLARLVAERRCLLILDGLEPLQEGGVVDTGKIKDPALFVLVRELARRNNGGLCIITSRLPLGGLKRFTATIGQINLENISDEAGRFILRFNNIRGSDLELVSAVQKFGNHAFAVNLLSSWLFAQPGHNISEIARMPHLFEDIVGAENIHIKRVIVSFEKFLNVQKEFEAIRLLRFMGLFNKPISEDIIQLLYDFKDLSSAIKTLRRYRLLYKESWHAIGEIDCHPLIREHFEKVLIWEEPLVRLKSHSILFEYYQKLPEKLFGKILPETPEEKDVLYLAITHGCKAERFEESLYYVFYERIRGSEIGFSENTTPTFNANITALSHFYKIPWSEIHNKLTQRDNAIILNWVGYNLRAIGQLDEAINVVMESFKIHERLYNWNELALNAIALCELYILTGQVKNAIYYGKRCVEIAMASKRKNVLTDAKAVYAHALHQNGLFKKAKHTFQQSEIIQQTEEPWSEYLYSIRGFRFNQLLLDIELSMEVAVRSKYMTTLTKDKLDALNHAINYLGISVVLLHLSRTLYSQNTLDTTISNLNHAISYFTMAGRQDYLPVGLLFRASYYRFVEKFLFAEEDLEEVLDIAEPSGMRLHLTDYHLEMARLRNDMGRLEEAKDNMEKAAKLIEETGYHRRDKELAELQAVLG
ncbi:MAG: hypothetical protein GC192_22170 [Bacteroidetes bacterium]|nr:hypothetical protein [Bacteroidota bacterium]